MIRIGKYTISEYDKRNLKVTALEKKTIESQMIADSMNKRDKLLQFEYWKVGDEYEHEEFIGYFPTNKPELAFERVYSLMVSEGCGMMTEAIQLLDIYETIKMARREVIEAAKGVEV